MPEDQVASYGGAASKLATWIKIAIKPERIASLDYKKDETLHKALREEHLFL